MLARVSLGLASGPDVLLAPKDAIVRQSQRQIIFVVEDDAVRAVPIRTGRSTGNRVEVVGDIEAGAVVVVRGNERLAPGQEVIIQTSEARSESKPSS